MPADVFLPSPEALLVNLRDSKEVCGVVLLHEVCVLTVASPAAAGAHPAGGAAWDVCSQQEHPECPGPSAASCRQAAGEKCPLQER